MASIQRTGFSKQTNELSNIFKALGHPARLNIIELLLDQGNINCKCLALELPLSNATVNRHIRVLYEQGIIGYEKVNNETFYTLNPIAVAEAKRYLRKTLESNSNNSKNYANVHFHLQPIS